MTIEKQIQKAANKKANKLMKELGSGQDAFETVWSSVAFLYPTADTHEALEYANKLASKRELI